MSKYFEQNTIRQNICQYYTDLPVEEWHFQEPEDYNRIWRCFCFYMSTIVLGAVFECLNIYQWLKEAKHIRII